MKDCENCKHVYIPAIDEPCDSCKETIPPSNWEPNHKTPTK